MQRHGAKETDTQPGSFLFGAAMAENIGAVTTFGTHMIAHILHDAEDGNAGFLEHVQPLAGINQSQILWRRNNDGAS